MNGGSGKSHHTYACCIFTHQTLHIKRVQTTKVEIIWDIQYSNIPIDIYDGDETLLLSMCAFYISWESP